MKSLQIEACQCLSRTALDLGPLVTLRASTQDDPNTVFELEFAFERKPFPMTFAQLLPHGPSIGAFEYIDAGVDRYFESRWPVCLMVRGNVSGPADFEEMSDDAICNVLLFIRILMWETPGGLSNPDIPPDQRATRLGYRRQFFLSQSRDFVGNRRHAPFDFFSPTEIGEPIGPGVVSLDLQQSDQIPNELVWSPTLSFPSRTNRDADRAHILGTIEALKRHYNSYNELGDATRLLEIEEFKSAIRAAASAVDAAILHLRQVHDIADPPRSLQFDEKIEHALAGARLPSYRALEPDRLQCLLYLYRARNSMHEGDCYYSRRDGTLVAIWGQEQARPLVNAAEAFVLWLDSLV